MGLIIIAAVAENGVIGSRGKIPWHIPEDFKRFKRLTLNHPVIMGKRTYKSILERNGEPLPQRTNIVLSGDSSFSDERIVVARTILEAVCRAYELNKPAFIIGGESIYRQVLPISSLMYLTRVNQKPEGDAFFPKFSLEQWKELCREDYSGYSFVNYKRISDEVF